jgi:hypothetical protein
MTEVLHLDHTSENLDMIRGFEHFHTYMVGPNTGQVEPNNLSHLGTVVWYDVRDDGGFTLAIEAVAIGQRSDNPHYNWLEDPDMRAEVFEEVFGHSDPCYVCGESIGTGEDCAEVVFGTVHGVCHAECALVAVDGGKGVWA